MGLPAASSSTCMGRVGLRLGVGTGDSSSCGLVSIILSSERVRVSGVECACSLQTELLPR